MEYRSVGNRCAVNLKILQLPITDAEALFILHSNGFRVLEINLIALARSCITVSQYRRGASITDAPMSLDCSSFIKWLYGQRGIWIPRRSIQQREIGTSVSTEEIIAGDVIFTSGQINYYHCDPVDGVGHVGIATEEGSVIHAADGKAHVIESSLNSFMGKTKFRGVRRYVSKNETVLTLETPASLEVETANDIRWIVLKSLTR